MSSKSAYALNGNQLFSSQLLKLDEDGLEKAILKVVPNIQAHWSDIQDMINDIPEEYEGRMIMPAAQKRFYIKSMSSMMKYLLEPKYEALIKREATTQMDPKDQLSRKAVLREKDFDIDM